MARDHDELVLDPIDARGRLAVGGPVETLPGATQYTALEAGDALVYEVPRGSLAESDWLSFDLLFEQQHMAKHCFALEMREAPGEPAFVVTYGVLPHIQARLRLPMSAARLNRQWLDREGALIKPAARGQPVDPAKVTQITIVVRRIKPILAPLRWVQTPLRVTADEPALLLDPVMPRGPLLDTLGQWTALTWPGRTDDAAQLDQRLRRQLATAQQGLEPDVRLSRWGGWAPRRVEATGFFRTWQDGRRWWLIDPDGHLFWMTGVCSVCPPPSSPIPLLEAAYEGLPPQEPKWLEAYRDKQGASTPDEVNFLVANFIRVFGEQWYDAWKTMILPMLRGGGFNTVGAFSDWEVARVAGTPYVRMLIRNWPGDTRMVFRDMPDVFADDFPDDAAAIAQRLAGTADDPAMVGYFLMNEPKWNFSELPVAAGMLYNSETAASRGVLADDLAARYGDDAGLARAWQMDVTLDRIRRGRWSGRFSPAALADLEAFSGRMIDRLFATLGDACRAVDPHHLNLGCRYAGMPSESMLAAMQHVDVLSINLYKRNLSRDDYVARLVDASERLGKPMLSGEWHFGAMDVGLPGIANQNVATQADRGRAFRVYQESAAALPCCVGTQYFRLYDNPALGRNDGENYNIGLLDVCNQPYRDMWDAARATHDRIYEVADGQVEPFDDAPAYLGI